MGIIKIRFNMLSKLFLLFLRKKNEYAEQSKCIVSIIESTILVNFKIISGTFVDIKADVGHGNKDSNS